MEQFKKDYQDMIARWKEEEERERLFPKKARPLPKCANWNDDRLICEKLVDDQYRELKLSPLEDIMMGTFVERLQPGEPFCVNQNCPLFRKLKKPQRTWKHKVATQEV